MLRSLPKFARLEPTGFYTLAKARETGAIKLENDNLGVINSLIYKRRPAREFALHCYFSILKEAKNMEWLDIRWIPRRMNKADRLFRF